MLTITVQSIYKDQPVLITWKKGEPLDLSLEIRPNDPVREKIPVTGVLSVTATGKELKLIKKGCSNIPMHDQATVRWGKPFCEFIVDFLAQYAEAELAAGGTAPVTKVPSSQLRGWACTRCNRIVRTREELLDPKNHAPSCRVILEL